MHKVPDRADVISPLFSRTTASSRPDGWSAATCRKLREALPANYRKRDIFYTDEYFICRAALVRLRQTTQPHLMRDLGTDTPTDG
jgi:hypothetical protein